MDGCWPIVPRNASLTRRQGTARRTIHSREFSLFQNCAPRCLEKIVMSSTLKFWRNCCTTLSLQCQWQPVMRWWVATCQMKNARCSYLRFHLEVTGKVMSFSLKVVVGTCGSLQQQGAQVLSWGSGQVQFTVLMGDHPFPNFGSINAITGTLPSADMG